MTAPVLLIGSIPLSSAEEVFLTAAAALPGRLQFIPDGETGIRSNYIAWQGECFSRGTLRGTSLPDDDSITGLFTLDAIKPSQYDTAALQSYETFVRLREKNLIPSTVRFQVCLPSPMACVQWHVKPEFHARLEPLYEQRILEARAVIVAKIPASDLAIQWDLCFEVMALEHERVRISYPLFKPHFSSPCLSAKEGILDRITRLCEKIPATVPLGFHFCYGDLGHRHFVEPDDTAVMVDLANSIAGRISRHRPVSWVHMPVPRARDDVAYFEPLRALELGIGDDQTRLYLGLVHADDDEGTRRRIRTAQAVVRRGFGVATECGLGRMPWEEVRSVLQILRDVTVLPVDRK